MIKIKNNLDFEELKLIEIFEKEIFYPNNYTYDEIKKMFESNNFYCAFKLDENNSILGYCIFYANDLEIEIYKIGVQKYFRKNNIGTEILNSIKEKFNKIFLEVSDRDDTKYFYLKNKFIEIGIRKKYYYDNSNAILLEWKKY